MNTSDVLIRQARLRDQPGLLLEIGITAGRVAAIEAHIDGTATAELDAHGKLVTEAFVNPHLHLCQVYALQLMDEEALRDYHVWSVDYPRIYLRNDQQKLLKSAGFGAVDFYGSYRFELYDNETSDLLIAGAHK